MTPRKITNNTPVSPMHATLYHIKPWWYTINFNRQILFLLVLFQLWYRVVWSTVIIFQCVSLIPFNYLGFSINKNVFREIQTKKFELFVPVINGIYEPGKPIKMAWTGSSTHCAVSCLLVAPMWRTLLCFFIKRNEQVHLHQRRWGPDSHFSITLLMHLLMHGACLISHVSAMCPCQMQKGTVVQCKMSRWAPGVVAEGPCQMSACKS